MAFFISNKETSIIEARDKLNLPFGHLAHRFGSSIDEYNTTICLSGKEFLRRTKLQPPRSMKPTSAACEKNRTIFVRLSPLLSREFQDLEIRTSVLGRMQPTAKLSQCTTASILRSSCNILKTWLQQRRPAAPPTGHIW